MSIRELGSVMQLAYVPPDFNKALDFWTKTMGVGPFFHLPHVRIPAVWYRGQRTTVDFSIALSYWGDLQIELIQPHDDTPSIYTDGYAAHGGLHHVCLLVEDMAQAKSVCNDAHAEIVQEYALDEGSAIYVDAGGGAGTLIELLEPPPAIRDWFAIVRAASGTWDGRDPLRTAG